MFPPAFDPEGTVLITGGTGGLGEAVARHLVEVWGAQHLVLASRRGPDDPQSAKQASGLAAEVTVAAADVSDPAAVADLVAGIDPAHPLTGVIHAAGVIDDGLITDLTPERLDRVWRPKAIGLANLHAATAEERLSFFVAFSSVAATLGSPAQANYAAANAYCDALMTRRHRAGQPGLSLAWGLWEQSSGMTGHLADADLARMRRSGLRPLRTDHALALLDAAVRDGRSLLVAADLDTAALTGAVPGILAELAAGRPAGGRRRSRRSPANWPPSSPGCLLPSASA